MRGEYVGIIDTTDEAQGSPPLARGILRIKVEDIIRLGITPACAGNTLWPVILRPCNRDHPRLRGEYNLRDVELAYKEGSPPLARGIPVGLYVISNGDGITPACAGNTKKESVAIPSTWDHPRLRGEYLSDLLVETFRTGSPPLARGIPSRSIFSVTACGITPACAGNTYLLSSAHRHTWDHPRLRGEYKNERTEPGAGTGSPPLARGIQSPRCGTCL